MSVDFIGIGVEKSATYWIADCLKEHPEVCFSRKKEIAFFNEYDQHYLSVKNPRYDWGIEWYEKHFDHFNGEKIKGEFTPTYLYSQVTAQRIKNHYPKAKLIVCLRDPVKRAHSQYLHDRSIGILPYGTTFSQALKKSNSYVEKGLYAKYLKHYFKLFGKRQIKIILTEDLRQDLKKVVRDIYSYLNIDPDYLPRALESKPNVASNAKFQPLNYFLLQTEYFLMRNNLEGLHKWLEDSGIRRAAFLFSYYVNRKPLEKYPKLDKRIERRLRKEFREDTEELEKLIKRDLSAWK